MPFQSQAKAKAVTADGDATQPPPTQSSPADEALEGKLLDDIEFGTVPLSKKMSKISKPRSKAPLKARATTRKPTVPRKTPQKLPSLPPSSPPLVLDEDEVCAVRVDLSTNATSTPPVAKKAGVAKKKEEKVVFRAQPSFDMDAIMNTTKSKPPVVYKNKSRTKRASQEDDDEVESASDDDQAESDSWTLWKKKDDEDRKEVEIEAESPPKSKAKVTPKASGKSKSKSKPTPQAKTKSTPRVPTQSRVPVVELPSKKSSFADLPVSPQESKDTTPDQESGIANERDAEVANVNAVDELEATHFGEEECPTATSSRSSPKVKEVIAPPVSDSHTHDNKVGRSSRAGKPRGTKRLAAYNLDELDADSGGTAGVVLEEMLSPVKKSRKYGPAPNSIKTSISAGTNTKAMDNINPDIEKPQLTEPMNDPELEAQLEVDELASPEEQDQDEVLNSNVEIAPVSELIVPEPVTRKSSPTKAVSTTKTETTPRLKPRPKSRKSTKQTNQDMITPSTPGIEHEVPTLTYDKDLILRMIIAKLESNKTCDWYELAIQLNEDGFGGVLGSAKKAKRGKWMSEDKVTGDELHELYHHTVLPALKVGKALWVDSPVDNVPSSPSDEVVTPPSQEVEMSECESEEEAPMPPPTKTKATRPRR